MDEITPPYMPQGASETTMFFDENTIPRLQGQAHYSEAEDVYAHEIVMGLALDENSIVMDMTASSGFTCYKKDSQTPHGDLVPRGISKSFFKPGNYQFTGGFAVLLSGKVPLLNNCVVEHSGTSKPGQWICALSPAITGVESMNYGVTGHTPYVAFLFWPHELEDSQQGGTDNAKIYTLVEDQLAAEGVPYDTGAVKLYIGKRIIGKVVVGGSVGGIQQILMF